MRKKTINFYPEAVHRPNIFIFVLLLGIVLFFFVPLAAEDYLIVNQPQFLRILNRYQQNLSKAEAADFPEFCPMKIVDDDVLLSDSYTSAIKILFNGKEYYLIKNAHGNLVDSDGESLYKRYKNVLVADDTVEITKDKHYRLQTPDFATHKYIYLKNNQKLKRIFSSGRNSFVRLIGVAPHYGWLDLSDTRFWHKYTPNPLTFQDSFIPVKNRLINRINQVNEIYAKLFNTLNTETGLQETAPYWKLEQSDRKLILTFTPERYHDYFSESIDTFLFETDSILALTVLRRHVTTVPLRFEIYDQATE